MSPILRSDLGRALMTASHRTGSFTLRSGQTSTEYFDKYQFEARPELLSSIALHLRPLIPPGTQLLAGLEMGGIPLASALGLLTGLPTVFVRKEAKPYGTCQLAEGPLVVGRRVLVIEDVITTGGQVVDSVAQLRSAGAQADSVLCVIDRSEGRTERLKQAGLSLSALFTMAELKSFS
jgi:orotate phosphoribosyltransferase